MVEVDMLRLCLNSTKPNRGNYLLSKQRRLIL